MTRHAVTGALGFSGRHITARLLARGDAVVNLTNHPDRPDPFGSPSRLRRSRSIGPPSSTAVAGRASTRCSTRTGSGFPAGA